jgi:ABC-type sugar transport system substrate-binding protein
VGTALGESAVKILEAKNGSPKGNLVELAGVLGSAPQLAMDKGFSDVISAYPDIKIVAVQDGNNERGPGLQIMEDFLTRFPKGKVDMVWAQNDEMGIGALKAIQAAGRDELFGTIISKDGQVEAIEQVAKGNFATVCTNTPYFGPIITPYVTQILAGEEVPTAPDKPFTCYESLTKKGKAEAQKTFDQMSKDDAKFSPR